MDITIVGAGLGGMAAGIALTQAGHSVTLLERSPEPRMSGAGIGVSPNGVRALDRIGLGDAIRAQAVPGDGDGTTRDRNGRPLLRIDQDAIAAAHGDPVVSLPRRTLAKMLMEALPADAIHTGAHVTDVHAHDGTVVTTTTTLHADLVVAADGARSRTRRTLFPDHPGLLRSGEMAIQAIVPGQGHDVTPIIGELLDRHTGGRFGCLPMADGSIYWYALWSARQDTPADPAELLHWLHQQRTDWHPAVAPLIAATPPEAIHISETAQLARPLSTFAVGRVAFLGDAAHAMTPDLGQGAGQAFEDAVALGNASRGIHPEQLTAMLRRYDAERRPPTSRMQNTARLTRRMSTLRGIPGLTRDTAFRMVPPRLATRMMTD